jgi:hypothetical protein
MKSIIVYIVTDKSKLEQPLTVRHHYVHADRPIHGGAWIRVEVVDAELDRAMDLATPMPGESFCNSHPLV